jgi:hypothetical protein
MKISPHIHLRLAKWQVTSTAFPTTVLLGASAVRLARQCPRTNLIGGTAAADTTIVATAPVQRINDYRERRRFGNLKTFWPVGLARLQRTGFNVCYGTDNKLCWNANSCRRFYGG